MAIRGRVVSRQRVCKYCGDLHEVSRWPDNCKDNPWPRSEHPAPYLISDSLPGGVNGHFHHAECRKTDSKSEFRRWTREHGCIEVGNEREAFEKQAAEERNRDLVGKDVIESGVNEALHQLGISSESDMGKIDYDNPV